MAKMKDIICVRDKKFIPVIVDENPLEKKYPTDYCKYCMFAPRNKYGQLVEASCTIRELLIGCGIQYYGYYKSVEDGV